MKVVLRARSEGKEILFEVGKMHVTLGRGDGAHIKVADEDCSRVHCKFYVEGNKLWVEDAGSKNGTFVNTVRIQQSQIFIHDRVKVGETEVLVPTEKNNEAVVQLLTFAGSSEERQRKTLDVEDTEALTQVRLNPMTALKASQIPQYRTSRKKLKSDPMFKDSMLEKNLPASSPPPPALLKSVAEWVDSAGVVVSIALPGFIYSVSKGGKAMGLDGIANIKKIAVVAGISLAVGFLFWIVNTKNSGASGNGF